MRSPDNWGVRLHEDLASNEIIKFGCGYYLSILLKEGGRIYGAGRSEYICGLEGYPFLPIPGLGDELVFIDIEMKSKHTLALTEDFQVFVWGDSRFGQLGLGPQKQRKNPVKLKLPSGLSSSPITIHCGPDNSWIYQGHWMSERYSRFLFIEDLNNFEF